MKRFKLGLVLLAFVAMTGLANAGGVGYIDYTKVIDNYDYAKKAIKEVDAKGLEMQQYLVDKEKEYKALDTPLKTMESINVIIKTVTIHLFCSFILPHSFLLLYYICYGNVLSKFCGLRSSWISPNHYYALPCSGFPFKR